MMARVGNSQAIAPAAAVRIGDPMKARPYARAMGEASSQFEQIWAGRPYAFEARGRGVPAPARCSPVYLGGLGCGCDSSADGTKAIGMVLGGALALAIAGLLGGLK